MVTETICFVVVVATVMYSGRAIIRFLLVEPPAKNNSKVLELELEKIRAERDNYLLIAVRRTTEYNDLMKERNGFVAMLNAKSRHNPDQMTLQTWRRIAKLSHPDVHNGSKEAEEVMKILLEMKPK